MKREQTKRTYQPPGIVNASQFERRGILTACCLTAGDNACESQQIQDLGGGPMCTGTFKPASTVTSTT